MPVATVVAAHDVQFAIMPFVSGIRVHFKIYVGVLWKAKLFHVSVPVPYADEQLLDVASRRVRAEGLIGHVEAQNSIVHKRSNLWSYIDAVSTGAILRCHQLSALSCGCDCENKRTRQATEHRD